MRKLLAVFFVFFVFLFIPLTPAFATDNFSTAYDVTYTVSPNGMTHAALNVTLTNKTNQYYASSYQVNVGFKDIENLRASDPDGGITPVLTKTDKGSTIDVDFNKRVGGIGNALVFTISFDTKEVAGKTGNIWEVNIPGLSNKDDFDNFAVHVRVPDSFGPPAYIKPATGSDVLDFTKEQLGQSGISLSFGSEQLYDFTLTYHIKNTKLFPIKTEIALPPSTNYQDIAIVSMTQIPENVTIDTDGNWLADYSLMPNEEKDIVVEGVAQLKLTPKKQVLSQADRALFTKAQPYWEASDPAIKKLAEELKTPDAIYQYVVSHLTYDFSKIAGSTIEQERLGAKNALQNPTKAICMEFTDLFVALTRAAGIPAKEIDGFAYTQNDKERPTALIEDILHAWPEYYDDAKGTWVMVDPTWGNTTRGTNYFTTLDFDHFAFVVKGKESNYPVSAGGYKLPGAKAEKNVHVVFGTIFPKPSYTLSYQTTLPKKVLSSFSPHGTISLRNTSGQLISAQTISLSSPDLTPRNQTVAFPQIPPYGSVVKDISFDKPSFLTNKKAVVTIRVGETAYQEFIIIAPLFFDALTISLGGILFALLTITIFYLATRSRHLPVPQQQGTDSVLRKSPQSPS